MDLKTIVARLDIATSEEALAPGWEAAQAARPAGAPPFLAPDYVHWACEQAFLTPEMTAAALAAARRIAADDALSALAWYCHYQLFLQDREKPEVRRWPLLTTALDRDAGMFYVLVLLSGTPQMQAVHRARRIPPEVIKDTVLDLKLQLETEDYFLKYGHWGISPRILGWLLLHWQGELYRLGRLQFVPVPFGGRLRAFRHHTSGIVVALSEAGVRYRTDGQVDGAGDVYDPTAWTSTLTLTGEATIGHPISPLGHVLETTLTLSGREWRQVLAPGDPTLDIHIPTGSPMNYDACGESLRQALAFFPRHFPDKPFVGFSCFSWILDAQFEQLLPPCSNLVRFQKEVYLFPIKGGSGGVINTVFGFGLNLADLPRFPRRTTMQRAFAAHLERGGHFRGGGCFLLKDDLDWGSQCYRRKTLPWLSRTCGHLRKLA